MLNIWRKVRKLGGHCLSLLTPIHDSLDFPPGLQAGLTDWCHKGIIAIGEIVHRASTHIPAIEMNVTNVDFFKYVII